MKKWEYRLENVSAEDFTDKKSLKEVKSFLSKIGFEGWELINVTSIGQKQDGGSFSLVKSKEILFVFKRELE